MEILEVHSAKEGRVQWLCLDQIDLLIVMNLVPQPASEGKLNGFLVKITFFVPGFKYIIYFPVGNLLLEQAA